MICFAAAVNEFVHASNIPISVRILLNSEGNIRLQSQWVALNSLKKHLWGIVIFCVTNIMEYLKGAAIFWE
jgi:hypothetical protein